MPIEIGRIEAIYRYPVKSMRGEACESVALGWHGLDGDRRFAFRKLGDRGGFPWLSAGRLPQLVLFAPQRSGDVPHPAHVRTPDGEVLPIFGEDLATQVESRCGVPVQMMQLNHGIFDEANISVITTDTVREIGRLADLEIDARRFRPNIVVRTLQPIPFAEDAWVGSALSFGSESDAPAVAVTQRDVRCPMVNIDPDTAARTPEVLKAVARANDNNAGIYVTVTRTGRLAVGQPVYLSGSADVLDRR